MKNLGKLARRIHPSAVVAALALFVVIGGTATAASGLISGKKIKPGTVTAKQLKNKTITSAKLAPATIDSLKGKAGPAGAAGPTGPAGANGTTGATGPAGLNGADAVIAPLESAVSLVNLPSDTQTELTAIDVAAGTYLLQAKLRIISQGPSSTNYIDCGIWTDDQSAVDNAGESPLAQNQLISLSMMAVATAAEKVSLRCNSDSGIAQASSIKLIAIPIQS